jgi:GGDEF domain-containing protein
MHGSVGISLFPGDADDETTLMQHADTAMYRAKRAARGAHLFWIDDAAAGRAGA